MAAAGVAPAAGAGPPQADVICLLDSDDDQPQGQQQRSLSGRGAGPSRQAAAGPSGRQQQQQQPQQQRRPAAAAGGSGGGNVIDLTSDSSPQDDGDLQIVRSTVQRVQRGPMRGVKRPRPSPQQAAQQLSPMKALLVQAARAAAALPPPEPEPEGPKCGICMESMGGSEGRQMASGTCGHVYCYDCLVEAVRAQKKCPTCRKGMQLRSIHKVFVNFS
ncbi:ubiquitin- ligase zinc ion binding [Chlorella sorokiniana]|uniref:Ubiquitin-ligase zinc ion binding n=1 Tax=Chlorella sorokiniana TaxID=3076 RepID=A0A2P6TS69_CHLSO|nr:ubiquitin- ligase zinc ion binding [Chlorella sorokiniana]|eukprot:PRW56909.1 ubiquitin- ligase zinc ion binding [Chlorella sorokiniana]